MPPVIVPEALDSFPIKAGDGTGGSGKNEHEDVLVFFEGMDGNFPSLFIHEGGVTGNTNFVSAG